MTLLRHLPNALTCGNLICGCLGLICLLKNYPIEPAYFIWVACVFDFFDGFMARMLKVSSSIGKELDSLADMVSFGVLPAITLYIWLDKTAQNAWMPYVGLLIAVSSALRLAKFNVDTRQTDSFIGVPTPANAIFLTSLIFLPEQIRNIVFTPEILMGITILFSFLLVSPLELFALKFKDFSWANNKLRFTFIILSVLLIAIYKAGALPFIILLYIFISLVSRIFAIKEN